MAYETVQAAITALEDAINEGEHNCSVQVEPRGDLAEVVFYLDGDTDEPVGIISIVPIPED